MKTYRFIVKDFGRQNKWRKFMKVFKAYPKGVAGKVLNDAMGW